MRKISSQQWEKFDRDGYLLLGRACSSKDIGQLGNRINDIMLGKK